MSHRDDLHKFDSYVSQMRSLIQSGEATLACEKVGEKYTLTVERKPTESILEESESA